MTIALERDRTRRKAEQRLADLKSRLERLSQREREVLALVTTGLKNKQIAFQLDVAEITVKARRGHVMQKMGAQSLADLVKIAETLGIKSPRSKLLCCPWLLRQKLCCLRTKSTELIGCRKAPLPRRAQRLASVHAFGRGPNRVELSKVLHQLFQSIPTIIPKRGIARPHIIQSPIQTLVVNHHRIGSPRSAALEMGAGREMRGGGGGGRFV